MKHLSIIEYAAALFSVCILSGCAGTGAAPKKEDMPQETSVFTYAYTEPYRNIVSPDFRQVLWGMTGPEIFAQEGRSADYVSSRGDVSVLGYDDVKEFGCTCRLDYILDSGGACTSAEYIISAEEQQSHYGDCMENVGRYLDELYAGETENPYGGDEIYRKTRSAEIFLSTDTGGRIHILFRMPEGYLDGRYEYHTILFDENGDIVS